MPEVYAAKIKSGRMIARIEVEGTGHDVLAGSKPLKGEEM